MKIHGKKIKSAYEDYLVIPRRDGDLVFKFKSVENEDDFNKLCPPPVAPLKQVPGMQNPMKNLNDPKYQEELDKWAMYKTLWMFINSILATDGLEFETVDLSDPTTYANYENEMIESGLHSREIALLMRKSAEVNVLSARKVEEATESFLAGLAVLAQGASTQDSDPNSI